MRALIWAYIGLFSLGHVALVACERFLVPAEERDPIGETVKDLALGAVLLAGMLFYQLGGPAELRAAWRVVSPCLLVILGLDNLRARRKVMATEELSRGEVASVDAFALVLLAPAVALNIAWAYA